VRLTEAAFVAWGAAYLWGTVLAGEPAKRLFELRLFGSLSPVAAMLEWVALALFTVTAMAAIGPRLRGRWRDAGLTIGSLIAAAVLAEGVFRAHTLLYPTTHGYNTYSNELWYQRYRTLNSLGYRDEEPVLARRPGRHRIVLIGDSFAFGNGIDHLSDRFGERLAAGLRHQPGGEWELFNASRGNTNTLDHLEVLPRMLPYHPDLVVLLYVFNDADYLKPRVSTTSASLPRDFRHDMTITALLMRNSYMFQETFLRLAIASYRLAQSEVNADDAYADSALVTRHLADLARFVSLARDGGASVRIVPFDIAVVADQRLRSRDERFVARAEAAGLPLCPIINAFDGRAFNSLTVNALDLHPNAAANALAANAALPCIARALSTPDSMPAAPRQAEGRPSR
jgi:hypothetical protein